MTAGVLSSVRFRGRVGDLSASDRSMLFDRSTSADVAVRNATATIVADVRARGDVALYELAERFDGVRLSSLEVPRTAVRRALDGLPTPLRGAMERAAKNIAAVHAANRPAAIETSPEPGITIVRRPDALGRAGVYAPGGRAAYPSSVLMAAIPARVAGVGEVLVCSPPDASGAPPDAVLAAAAIAGVDRVFSLGGAGAIAAMAFGTDTVPRADRIVGPGNAYVAEAKLQVAGFVGIDTPAGPSELLVIADDSVDPAIVAGELIAQAEHDPSACVVAIAVGDGVARRIEAALDTMAGDRPRQAIVAEALSRRGAVLSAADRTEAIAFANAYAPEHLLLVVARSEELVGAVRNAGTVFVGSRSSVAFGDYMTGANHVLPTGGLARSYSGLSTSDFVRWTTIQTITPSAAASLASDVAVFAEAEGLPGHAAAARAAGGVS